MPYLAPPGAWAKQPNGQQFWQTGIRVESAGGLRIHFQNFNVGNGKVWVHDGNPVGQVFGPYSGRGLLGTGEFWTEMVFKETIWIEYITGDGKASGKPPFEVPDVFELWPKDAGYNATCLLDASCYTQYPNVQQLSEAVAYLIFPDTGESCTGTLINDKNSTNTPYLLTAGHCVTDVVDAEAMLAIFEYKTPYCDGAPPNPLILPQVSGSTLLARSLGQNDEVPDFAFVRLAGFPPGQVYLVGWTGNPDFSQEYTSLSHPHSLPQMFAAGYITSLSTPGFYFLSTVLGAVDHGSSGSGLLTNQNQLVAVLHAGPTTDNESICDVSSRQFEYTSFASIFPFIAPWLLAPGSQAAPSPELAPQGLTFAPQVVGTQSAQYMESLKNIGNAALNISSIGFVGTNPGDFIQTNNCGASLAAGGSCSIFVSFRPTATGTRSASLFVSDNAAGSPQTIGLQGSGIVSTPPILNSALTSNIAVPLPNNGLCGNVPPVTAFLTTDKAVWVYYDVNAHSGDFFQTLYYRPDGNVYETTSLTAGINGNQCFAFSTPIAGSAMVSYPGTWRVATFANHSSTPLFSLNFLLSSSSALQFMTVKPCRVLDTRLPPTSPFPANSTFGSPYIAAETIRNIPIPQSSCGVPTNAVAYSLNFTVQPRTPNLGYLTVWPANTARPNVSTVSFSNPAVVLASAAILGAGTAGSISATATQDIDLVVDINGYFVPPAANTLQFYPLPPCRVLDTRTPANGGTFPPNSTFGSPGLDGVHPRSFPISSSSCGVPATAAAYSFNIGVVPSGALYFLASYPAGGSLPVVSTMNSFDGTILANASIVPAGPGGAVNFFASNPADFFVDINGYFAPSGAGGLNFYTLAPCRLVDTRNANGTFGGPSFGADAIRSIPLPSSACGIPAAVHAYSLGITVYPTSGPLSYLTVWPTGGAQPFVSTLNAFKGLPIANAALVPAGTGGAINVFVTNKTDVTIDTAGYFGP
jgi:hypothetical protein